MIKVGDIIYVPSAFYLSHGADDFIGGKATVERVYQQMSGGKMVTFVSVKEKPESGFNWEQFLSRDQSKLEKQFGDKWCYAQPDNRPEFNKWD